MEAIKKIDEKTNSFVKNKDKMEKEINKKLEIIQNIEKLKKEKKKFLVKNNLKDSTKIPKRVS